MLYSINSQVAELPNSDSILGDSNLFALHENVHRFSFENTTSQGAVFGPRNGKSARALLILLITSMHELIYQYLIQKFAGEQKSEEQTTQLKCQLLTLIVG